MASGGSGVARARVVLGSLTELDRASPADGSSVSWLFLVLFCLIPIAFPAIGISSAIRHSDPPAGRELLERVQRPQERRMALPWIDSSILAIDVFLLGVGLVVALVRREASALLPAAAATQGIGWCRGDSASARSGCP